MFFFEKKFQCDQWFVKVTRFMNHWVVEKLFQCFSKLLFDSLAKNKHFRKWLGDHSVHWNNNDVCPTKSKTRKNWGEFQKRSARSLNKCWEINLLLRTWARVRITIVVSRYTTNITTRNRITDWFDYLGNSLTTSLYSQRNDNGFCHGSITS